jgi:hypothetical protein
MTDTALNFGDVSPTVRPVAQQNLQAGGTRGSDVSPGSETSSKARIRSVQPSVSRAGFFRRFVSNAARSITQRAVFFVQPPITEEACSKFPENLAPRSRISTPSLLGTKVNRVILPLLGLFKSRGYRGITFVRRFKNVILQNHGRFFEVP